MWSCELSIRKMNKTTNCPYIFLYINPYFLRFLKFIEMQVVILAAGRGKRMGKYTQQKTKAMLPIGKNKTPLLSQTVANCQKNGLKKFIFVVGYRKEEIIDFFGSNDTDNESIFNYVEQMDIIGGTANAVKIAQKYINSDQFLLIYGDVVPSVKNIANILNLEPNTSAMGVRRVDDPRAYGVVELCDDKIINIVEKSPNPPSNLVNAGLYVLQNPEIFKFIDQTRKSARGEYELTESIQKFIDDGGVMYHRDVQDGIKNIGTLEDYEKYKMS